MSSQQYFSPITDGGHQLSIAPYPYRRRLRESTVVDDAGSRAGKESPLKGAVTAVLDTPPSPGINNLNASGRLHDMDVEGVDVHLIIPGTFAMAVAKLDTEMANEVHDAYRRYIAEYCTTDPARLKATVPVLGSDPDRAAAVVREVAAAPWAAAITPVLPEGLPVDDPVLDPVWAAMNEADLPIMHHSFFYEPPYFPGYRDLWGNVVVARVPPPTHGAPSACSGTSSSAACSTSSRTCASALPSAVPGGCQRGWSGCGAKPSTCVEPCRPTCATHSRSRREGHIFCGIELYEGEEIARSINDLLGDGVIMYQSDFPHNGCLFPSSPDVALSWTGLGEASMRRLMSENAERYLRL